MGEDSRTFVRGLESDNYELEAVRQMQLAHHRVRDETIITDTGESVGHSGATKQSRVSWRIGPGDEDFLTQTLQVHFIEIDGHGSNHGHGHQNEAAFYILEGAGYEIHDDLRYDWKKDDLVFVHTDSVHRHFNPYDEKAVALVVKAKCTWMFMGLLQQGRGGPIDREAEFGPREDWSAIWTPGVLERTKKIVSPEDTVWEDTDLGRIRVMTSPRTDHARLFSVDVLEFEIPARRPHRPSTGRWPTRSSTSSTATATRCTGRCRPRSPSATTRTSPRSRSGTTSRRATPSTSRRTRWPSTSPPTAPRSGC